MIYVLEKLHWRTPRRKIIKISQPAATAARVNKILSFIKFENVLNYTVLEINLIITPTLVTEDYNNVRILSKITQPLQKSFQRQVNSI